METDIVVIGGGVIGLAIAAQLAPTTSLVLFERHRAWGQEISSRNSEVLHAGVYYAPGSLKATLCVRGQHLLYELAQTHAIAHRKCGKIIVASAEDEMDSLLRLKERAEQNGVADLDLLSGAEVARREPMVRAVAGLLVPHAGIINAHALMDTLAAIAQRAGADLVCGGAVTGLQKEAGGWRVSYRDSDGDDALQARVVINCAGLGAQAVMRMAGIDPDAIGLTRHAVKGEYFSVSSAFRNRIHSLIYSVPAPQLVGLGVHTVPDLAGGLKLGPNAFYVEQTDDYRVDPAHAEEFFASAQRYLPALQRADLQPDMSGIRPKLSAPGEAPRDFYIRHERARGADGLINLAGIESPGLTSCCAIAERVEQILRAELAERS